MIMKIDMPNKTSWMRPLRGTCRTTVKTGFSTQSSIRPGCRPLRRRQPERIRWGYCGGPQRCRQCGGAHAAPGTCDRRADRPRYRRSRLLHLGAPSHGGPVSGEADTVTRAAATPGQPQPYAELGLTSAEYERIGELLGRRPTDAELAIYSVMWSEHCSYKSSKVHLRS